MNDRYAYLDIEATHNNWNNTQIIEIAFIIKDENGKDLDFFHSLIRPRNTIAPEITKLTGITNNMLENSPELHQLAQKIHEKLVGCIIVAHKAQFDYDLLNQEMSALNLPLSNKKICTLSLSQSLIPGLKSYSLVNLCKLFQIPIKNQHRALEDAIALSTLHRYLMTLKAEPKEKKVFLPQHQKLINKTAKSPGIITLTFENDFKVYKSDNLFVKLSELLTLNNKSKTVVLKIKDIKVIHCASVVKAGLLKISKEKLFYPYCIYSYKRKKDGKIFIKVGKTKIHKKALYYTKSYNEAIKMLNRFLKDVEDTKFAYLESTTKENIISHNTKMQKIIKSFRPINKFFLVKSFEKINGLYEYTIINKNFSYATFTSKEIIKNTNDLSLDEVKFKKMMPRQYMDFIHSLNLIKNQKHKTDHLIELKSDILKDASS